MSSLISGLPNDVVRGITLNNQHMDLFAIIDDSSLSEDDKKTKVVDYLIQASKIKAHKRSVSELIKVYTNYTAEKLGLSDEDKKRIIDIISNNVNSLFDRSEMIEVFKQNGFSNSELINDTLMEATSKILNRTKEGIPEFLILDGAKRPIIDETYQKVKAFYDHVTGLDNGRPRYNRIDLDDIAAPSGFLSIQMDNIVPGKLKRALEFCNRHNMSAKINSVFFYMHSHFPTSPAINTREDLIKYYNNYINSVSSIIEGSNVEEFDMFNEFVYRDQPQKIEDGDYQYGERHNGFHALLSLDDICNIAKSAREKMPNVKFLYNDDGWEKPEKREGIFREIEKIKQHEDSNHKLIDAIGMQFHTGVDIDISEIRKSIEECRKRFPDLPIKITELDIDERISGFDKNTVPYYELASFKNVVNYRKKLMMNEFLSLAQEGQISEITLWSQSDEMSFRGGNSSLNRYDNKTISYSGLDTEISKEEQKLYEHDLQVVCRRIALDLAKECKTNNIDVYKKLLSRYMPEVSLNLDKYIDEVQATLNENNKKQEQEFNFHTHTLRCGHAAEFTEDFEYVEEALKGGLTQIAFTDHMPYPLGEKVEPSSRMQYQETDDYLASIEYLKHEYGDLIDIKSGFEFEYLPRFDGHIKELKSKSDMMILGQHFIERDDGKKVYFDNPSEEVFDEDLDRYADYIVEAINKGYPDIIAHPDQYMLSRNHFGEKEKEIAYRICTACKENNIPLEINMGNLYKNLARLDDNLTMNEKIDAVVSKVKIPCKEFFEIAKEVGCSVLYGKDAHYPTQLSEDRDIEIIKKVLGPKLISENGLTFFELEKKSDKVISIDESQLENLALSEDIDLDVNQTTSAIIDNTTKSKESKGVDKND